MNNLDFLQGRFDGAAGAGKTPDPDDQSDYAKGWREGRKVAQRERENTRPRKRVVRLTEEAILYVNGWR